VCPRRALVTAASGLGDILRATPLIRVCAAIGYEVDVLIAPDYPETATLLENAPEIHQLFCRPSRWGGMASVPASNAILGDYDVATFTYWSASLQSTVRADRVLIFDSRKWLIEGDHACVLSIARQLGWNKPLSSPFAVTSNRDFALSPGTIALHPGCKPDWPWKKWHGFADLARLRPEVVVIGTASDLDNSKTYFSKEFTWPAEVRNFVGQLSLFDTAALLKQCAALISNDSGMMHLAVALGVPAFGIFGITSPQRESIPAPNMFPITKGLSCENACHRGRWGRRDCEHHLQCLKTLTPTEVLEKVCSIIPLERRGGSTLASRC
jgi:ADP-heptose:LPS heptosyltransferase